MRKFTFALATALLLVASAVFADFKVTLNWDPNDEIDLEGYKIYYKIGPVSGTTGPPYDGTGALTGDSPITVQITNPSGTTDYYIPNSDPVEYQVEFPEDIFGEGMKVYFAVTAYDNESPSLEGSFSNEIFVVLPTDYFKGRPPTQPGGLSPTEIERIIKIVRIERTITRYNRLTEVSK